MTFLSWRLLLFFLGVFLSHWVLHIKVLMREVLHDSKLDWFPKSSLRGSVEMKKK